MALLVTELLASIGREKALIRDEFSYSACKRQRRLFLLTNVLCVLAASLHLRLIVWHRKDLLNASQLWHRPVCSVVQLPM